MGKKKRNSSSSQFKLGKLGGCEALLYEFRERFRAASAGSAPENSSCPPEPHSMRLAATTFDEAFIYLRRRRAALRNRHCRLPRPYHVGFRIARRLIWCRHFETHTQGGEK